MADTDDETLALHDLWCRQGQVMTRVEDLRAALDEAKRGDWSLDDMPESVRVAIAQLFQAHAEVRRALEKHDGFVFRRLEATSRKGRKVQ